MLAFLSDKMNSFGVYILVTEILELKTGLWMRKIISCPCLFKDYRAEEKANLDTH